MWIYLKMVLEEKDELLEFMKTFGESPIIGSKQSAIKANNGHRIIVKDSIKGYIFGEVKYIKRCKTSYDIKGSTGVEMKLSYCNLEKIFVNNKKH